VAIEVNIHEAKARFSQLLSQALAGEEVIILRDGKPVARLKPLRPARQFGIAQGDFVVPDDFDAPLLADILASFEQ